MRISQTMVAGVVAATTLAVSVARLRQQDVVDVTVGLGDLGHERP